MIFRDGKLLFVLLIAKGLGTIEGFSFNGKLMGVELNPYITADGPDGSWSSYTVKNVRTMLEVISSKFSRILIACVDAGSKVKEPYKKNDTYYKAPVRARTAEIAAHINRERGNLLLTVAVGILLDQSQEDFNREMYVALEASQIANSIFPGTVNEIFIQETRSVEENLKASIKNLRERSTNLGLRIGIKRFHKCEVYMGSDTTGRMLVYLDFIICPNQAAFNETNAEKVGAIDTFFSLQPEVIAIRDNLKSVKNNIDVMWFTSWIAQRGRRLRNNVTRHIRDLRNYWFLADKFATQNNYPVWICYGIGDSGWWKLTRDDLINSPSGYVEYVSALPEYFVSSVTEAVIITSTEAYELNKSTTSKMPENDSVEIGTGDVIKETIISTTDGNQSKTEVVLNTSISFATNIFADTDVKENESMSQIWIYISIVMGTLSTTSLLVGLLFFVYRRRKYSRRGVLTRQEIQEFRHGLSQNDYHGTGDENFVNQTAVKQPYNKLLEIPKQKLEILTNQMLGGGEFGCVMKALIQAEEGNQMEVALKTTKPNAGATTVKGFLSEIKILTYLGQHPNVVPFLGAYTAEMHKGTVYIATELCPLGSLRSCLKICRETKSDRSSFILNDMIRWSHEIACGMEYLEEKAVIHADLATRNILLSSESTAKITDFGLSRRMYEYTNYTKTTQEPLPWRWMAFESLKLMEFSSKSDVWSYGVTLWEIFSLGAQPYPGIGWTLDFVESLECGFRLKKPEFASSEMFEVIEKCWILDKNARPSFTELKNSTRQMQTKAMDSLYTTLPESDVCSVSGSEVGTTASASSAQKNSG